MKIDQVQQSLKGRCLQALTSVKKKAHDIKRTYHGEVYLKWCSDHPFKIVLIERSPGAGELSLITDGVLPTDDPPRYSIVNKPALRTFEPDEIAKCLDDSAKTLHKISEEISQAASQAASQDRSNPSMTEKRGGMTYREMSTLLLERAEQLREVRAAELYELA